ncbi:DUF1963 domain-containing protein [Streptomyces bambusae]|uniref:DUF1963 domain-containing protein n=1 Tax=Streptomyces bambusae TaxID=1550616 RepID=UPI001CFCFD0D|nr:DUF1963 domain-containing protein [Streptomyces bambusae]MCB5168800.1 DUF1963 domain-containing protein [Streptomyces bambusae]
MSIATLLIHGGAGEADAAVSRVGGVPLVPAGTDWPVCASCLGALQFIAQIVLDGDRGVVSAFMCANDPGMCEEWDAGAGGNRAFLFPAAGLVPMHPADPAEPEDVRLLGAVRIAEPVRVDPAGHEDAAAAWSARTGRPQSEVLGQLGGEPDWLQFDETPGCAGCGTPMAFVAQLDEGPDPLTAPNFGSGTAYLHACEPCGRAAFLWQC